MSDEFPVESLEARRLLASLSDAQYARLVEAIVDDAAIRTLIRRDGAVVRCEGVTRCLVERRDGTETPWPGAVVLIQWGTRPPRYVVLIPPWPGTKRWAGVVRSSPIPPALVSRSPAAQPPSPA